MFGCQRLCALSRWRHVDSKNIITFLSRFRFCFHFNWHIGHTHTHSITTMERKDRKSMGLFVYSNNWLQVDDFKLNSWAVVYISLFSRSIVVYLKLFSCQFDERRTFKHTFISTVHACICVCVNTCVVFDVIYCILCVKWKHFNRSLNALLSSIDRDQSVWNRICYNIKVMREKQNQHAKWLGWCVYVSPSEMHQFKWF